MAEIKKRNMVALTRDDIIGISDRCITDEIEEARSRAIKAYEERERLIQDIEYLSGMTLKQIRELFAAGYELTLNKNIQTDIYKAMLELDAEFKSFEEVSNEPN